MLRKNSSNSPYRNRGAAVGGGHGRGATSVIAVGAIVTLASVVGCRTGSLATDTGSVRPWSREDIQYAHLGEHVNFSFALTKGILNRHAIDPTGLADYCIATAGGEHIEADLDGTGHYRFVYEVVDHQPGDEVVVRAAAFRQRGVRDARLIGDRWVRAELPGDLVDSVIASDALRLILYATRVELPIDRPALDLNMDSGRLEIVKSDGSTSVVRSDGTGTRGYNHAIQTYRNGYLVTYDPTIDQLNTTGQTYVRFITTDHEGLEHTFDGNIPTP